VKTLPYFTTSADKFRPHVRWGETIFSSEGPWPDANYIFMNYCSQDGWLGRVLGTLYDGFYIRGSYNFQYTFLEVLANADPLSLKLILVGSSAGAIGMFNHLEWITETFHLSTTQINLILDSFYAPVTQVTPSKVWIIDSR
jgi:hypothetical protein